MLLYLKLLGLYMYLSSKSIEKLQYYDVSIKDRKLRVAFNRLPNQLAFYVQRNESDKSVELLTWLHGFKTAGDDEMTLVDETNIDFENWEQSLGGILRTTERPITLQFRRW